MLELDFERAEKFRGTYLYRQKENEAYAFTTKHTAVDADGAPNAYHPGDKDKHCGREKFIGLDCLEHAGFPNTSWWDKVLVPDPNDSSIAYRQNSGKYEGFFVCMTSLRALGGDKYSTSTYVDATSVPYVVIPTGFNALPNVAKSGDVGFAVDKESGKCTAFIVADYGGGSDAKLGEGSISLFEILGGKDVNPQNGRGVARGTYQYVLFPGSRFSGKKRWPRSNASITKQVHKLLRSTDGIKIDETILTSIAQPKPKVGTHFLSQSQKSLLPEKWMVEAAPDGAHGFDANTKITKSRAKKLYDAGFRFAVRYLTRGKTPPAHDLDSAEVSTILDSGLALMAVQHVAKAGWKPTLKLGKTYGKNAAAHAQSTGLPLGIILWLDLEGVDGSVPPDAVIQYCNAWHKEVEAAGYVPGIYVGSNCGLSGDQLFWNLRMKFYWQSGSKVPNIPQRGYCMFQTIIPGDEVGGVEIDRNIIRPDGFGATPLWARKYSAAQSNPIIATSTAHDDEAVLSELARKGGLEKPMARLIEYRNRYQPTSHPRYWAIVDFNLHSSKPRMFIYDCIAGTRKDFLCAHGKGSEGATDDGMADVFSNVDGSSSSSLGIFKCAEQYFGQNGKSMRLDGLEATNSHARHRAVVVHGANYVSKSHIATHGRIGRSRGCPAVPHEYISWVVDALKDGSFMIVWK